MYTSLDILVRRRNSAPPTAEARQRGPRLLMRHGQVTLVVTIATILICHSSHGAHSAEGDHKLVAKIDTIGITVADLLRFKADTPALLRSSKEGVEELDEYLRDLIDMQLLLLEARVTGIDSDPTFVERWDSEYKNKIAAEYLERRMNAEGDFSEEGLRQLWAQSKWRRMLKLARIRVEDGSGAQQILRELEGGADFQELAMKRSIDAKTAPVGGRLLFWFGRLNVGKLATMDEALEIAETLFELPVGSVAGPFQTADGYELYQLMDEKSAPLDYFITFAKIMQTTAYTQSRDKLYEELPSRFDAELDPAAIDLLAAKIRDSTGDTLELSNAEEKVVLCRFRGGELTLKEFAQFYPRILKLEPTTIDSAAIPGLLRLHVLPDLLLPRAAQEDGITGDSTIVAWAAARKRALLIEMARARAVDEMVDLSDDAIRQYYDTHPEQFAEPGAVEVLEILSESEAEAQEILSRIKAGEEMSELVARHSVRKGDGSESGFLRLHPSEVRRFGPLLRATHEVSVGELLGPVEVRDVTDGNEGFSVLKIVGRIPGQTKPFERVKRQARYWLRTVEEKRLSEEFSVRLRQKYSLSIVVYREQLQGMSAGSSM